MKNLTTVVLTLALAWWPITATAQAGSEEDLKATHRLVAEAARTGNVAFMESVIHPRALGFMRGSQMIVELDSSTGAREIVTPLIVDMSRFLLTPYQTVFRALGDTGVVCTTVVGKPLADDPKTGKKGPDMYNRATYLYARLDGRWRLVSWHSSDIPLKK